MPPISFAAVGECMVELSSRGEDLWRMGFAGDTFNTAYYVRAILPKSRGVAYLTCVGDDPMSRSMSEFFARCGIDIHRVRSIPGRRPGLYAITLDGAERTFTYWRGESAARQLADDPDWLATALSGIELVYFSGITLAILDGGARSRLLDAIAARRAAGGRVAFDPNYRAALWPDREVAKAAMQAAYRVADVVLPTFDDEALLFGDVSPETTAARIAADGVAEVVVKNGDEPCLIVTPEEQVAVPAKRPETVVDTTGAGDAFCGAYLAGRLTGLSPAEAARLGHAIAAQVIGVRGALAEVEVPRDAIPTP